MRTNASITMLGLAAALAATTALAQAPQPDSTAPPSSPSESTAPASTPPAGSATDTSQDTAGSDPGFFRPSPDPALTTLAPVQAAEATSGNGAAGATMPDARAELEEAQLAEARRTQALLWAEEQLDRAEQESEEARERLAGAPPSVGAAFTGSTNPEDR